VEPGEEVKTPSSEVHVVLPCRLKLSCLPADSWTVPVWTELTIAVKISDVDGNRVHLIDRLGTLDRALVPGEKGDGVVQPV
jgi:hypothetical protein